MDSKLLNIFLKSNIANWIYKNNKTVVIILPALSFLGLLYLILSFSLIKINIDKEIYSLVPKQTQKSLDTELTVLKKESYYTNPISKRNIFKSISKKQEVSTVEEISYKVVESLKLKGIMRGKFIKAVIEDTKDGKTYLVGEGEKFNSIEVKRIENSTVILYYKDKDFKFQL